MERTNERTNGGTTMNKYIYIVDRMPTNCKFTGLELNILTSTLEWLVQRLSKHWKGEIKTTTGV